MRLSEESGSTARVREWSRDGGSTGLTRARGGPRDGPRVGPRDARRRGKMAARERVVVENVGASAMRFLLALDVGAAATAAAAARRFVAEE